LNRKGNFYSILSSFNISLRTVGREEGESLAKDLDTLFMEVSAKSSLNVGNIFQVIAGFLPGNESHRMHLYEDNRKYIFNDLTSEPFPLKN